jgi:hypothetical protein
VYLKLRRIPDPGSDIHHTSRDSAVSMEEAIASVEPVGGRGTVEVS